MRGGKRADNGMIGAAAKAGKLVVAAEDGDKEAARELYKQVFETATRDAKEQLDEYMARAIQLGVEFDAEEAQMKTRVFPSVAVLDTLRGMKAARLPEETKTIIYETIPNWVVALATVGEAAEVMKFFLDTLAPMLEHASLLGFLLGRALDTEVFNDVDAEANELSGLVKKPMMVA